MIKYWLIILVMHLLAELYCEFTFLNPSPYFHISYQLISDLNKIIVPITLFGVALPYFKRIKWAYILGFISNLILIYFVYWAKGLEKWWI